jgi:transcriptional regulator with XRE-family HTH domain
VTTPQEFRRLRKELGVTQDELCKLTGISASTIATYEKSQVKTHKSVVISLWAALQSVPSHHTLAETARSIQWRKQWSHSHCAQLSGISEKVWGERVWRRMRARKPHPHTTERLKAFVQRWGATDVELGTVGVYLRGMS